MSWDLDIVAPDDHGTTTVVGEWNYTHNTNAMIHEALDRAGWELPPSAYRDGTASWCEAINGADGPTAARFFDAVIGQLEADPNRYEAMNPPNKWGSYSSLLAVLREIRAHVPDGPCTLEVGW